MSYASIFIPGIHKDITEEAMDGFNFSAEATRKVVNANLLQDTGEMKLDRTKKPPQIVPNEKYNPAHHFDRNPPKTNAQAAADGAAYVKGKKDAIIEAIQACDFEKALNCLGAALHAIQDFYSHSNYVDLSAADQAAADKAVTDPNSPMPDSVQLTGYDKGTGKDPVGDPYGHDAKSKDSPNKNDESKKKDANDKTNHEKAKDAATKASKAFIQCIKDEVDAKKWEQFVNWKPG
ncbi:MAG: hypothetical protein KF784_05660 [Fimbriimonadaceae bacterium]|nr:hypothetical protein [Fimbriimonadaceae bacterium]